jgi:hypothetical protein
MLSNSLAAACLATAYLLSLIVELNPKLSLDPARLAPFVKTIGFFYAVHFTVPST